MAEAKTNSSIINKTKAEETMGDFWLKGFAVLGMITAGCMFLHLWDKFTAYLLK